MTKEAPPRRPTPALEFSAVIERHRLDLPRYILLPIDPPQLRPVDKTFVADVEIIGFAIGHRTVKPWGDGRWFFELTGRHCEQLGVETGRRVWVRLRRVLDPTRRSSSRA